MDQTGYDTAVLTSGLLWGATLLTAVFGLGSIYAAIRPRTDWAAGRRVAVAGAGLLMLAATYYLFIFAALSNVRLGFGP